MREETVNWIKQADHDIKIAKCVFDDGGYDTCAFLCQQAVEKYLKALFIHINKKAPPRTHYLDELGKGLHCSENILLFLKDLSADYMISRYPDVANGAPFEEYTSVDAEEKIKKAEFIIQWIKELIICPQFL
ncbi:HEPN domain-containing protein [Candidatus Saganbacteria bacterium]|nr:HEPN domain-containing protein [Candidatus Saganbacteria bacterium]